jgi:hypothetical protein
MGLRTLSDSGCALLRRPPEAEIAAGAGAAAAGEDGQQGAGPHDAGEAAGVQVAAAAHRTVRSAFRGGRALAPPDAAAEAQGGGGRKAGLAAAAPGLQATASLHAASPGGPALLPASASVLESRQGVRVRALHRRATTSDLEAHLPGRGGPGGGRGGVRSGSTRSRWAMCIWG